jgi:hypothetical protein
MSQWESPKINAPPKRNTSTGSPLPAGAAPLCEAEFTRESEFVEGSELIVKIYLADEYSNKDNPQSLQHHRKWHMSAGYTFPEVSSRVRARRRSVGRPKVQAEESAEVLWGGGEWDAEKRFRCGVVPDTLDDAKGSGDEWCVIFR